MAQIPVPRSYPQIVGDMIDAFLSRYGLKSLKAGSPVLSLIEAAAQSDIRSSQDIFQLLNATSLDNAEGQALDRIGADELVPRITESAASGLVNIDDTSFVKVSTKIYQGLPAPIAGALTINVADASSFSATGNVYLGRGTANFEGPLPYTAVTPIPSLATPTYWTITLSSPTAKFHNLGETVVMAQGGNRLIGGGTVAQTPQGNLSNSIQFSVLYSATLPDGEVEVTNVQVVAKRPGVVGNVAAGAISQFQTAPFTGAAVTNPRPFSNGLATETDDAYRERIRNARASRARGTALALKTFTVGAVSPDENKRVISASVVTQPGVSTTMYIDDGTGYEEISEGIALETLMDSAMGGEQYFQISEDPPITKANLETLALAPFILSSGMQLSFSVGGVVTAHTFNASEFRNITAATAYEVVASINSNTSLGWSARTGGSGSQVIVFAKANINEDLINVAVTNDANSALQFPGTPAYTTRLYKNDRLLTKDGKSAAITGNSISMWGTLTSPQTLTIGVDGTTAQTYTFTDADFIAANTGFGTLSTNSLDAWVVVINAKIPGITASISGDAILLSSNLGASARAGISIPLSGGSLVTNLMFSSVTVVGAANDYLLDRNTGQFTLVVPLSVDDKLTLGSDFTRAFLDSQNFLSSVVVTTTPIDLWFSIDNGMTLVPTGVVQGTVLTASASEVRRWGYRIRLTSNAALNLFGSVTVGDWLIPWDTSFTSYMNSAWRVARVASPSATYLEIEKPNMMSARAGHTATVLNDGRVLIVGGMTREEFSAAFYLGRAPTTACEIYDPITSTWMAAASMGTARARHTASLLSDGRVFVFGGSSNGTDSGALASGEIYNPTTNTWSGTANITANARWKHSAVVTGTDVLIIGGKASDSTYLASNYSYAPGSNTWTPKGNLGTARANMMTRLLTTGDVVVAGGENPANLSSDEFSTSPYTVWSTNAAQLSVARHNGGTAILPNGKVVIAGGATSADETTGAITNSAAADIYTPGGVGVHGTWSALPSLNTACSYNSLISASGGNLVSAFGFRSDLTPDVGVYNGTTVLAWAYPTGIVPLGTFNRIRPASFSVGSNGIVFSGGSDGVAFQPTSSSEQYTTGVSVFSNVGGLVRTGGNLVTVTTSAPHGLTVSSIFTYVLAPGEANFPAGNKTITITGASTFTYSEAGSNVASTAAESFTPIGAWTQTDRVLGVNPITISASVGFAVGRTLGLLQRVVVPIGSTYTATSLASTILPQLRGAFTSIFNTGQIRVSTDSYQDRGDIGLVEATNTTVGFEAEDAIHNIAGQQGAVESGNSERGTPDFRYIMISGSAGPLRPILDLDGGYNQFRLPSLGASLLVLRSYFDAINTTIPRWGTNRGVYTGLSSIAHDGTLAYLVMSKPLASTSAAASGGGLVRTGGNLVTVTTSTAHGFYLGQIVSMNPGETNFPAGDKIVNTIADATHFTYLETSSNATSASTQTFSTNPSSVRLWESIQKTLFVAPYAISPSDSLTTVVDGDVAAKRYAVNMFRNLGTVGTTYSSQIEVTDKDGGVTAISNTFGTNYDFTDFAVFMPARTKTHDATATKRILWRYKRVGPDGNFARLRYILPSVANAPVGVTIDNTHNDWTNLNVTLGSGALKTGYSIRAVSYIGAAATSVTAGLGAATYVFNLSVTSGSRTTNLTTLTLGLPAGITDHGLVTGDIIYFASTSGSFLSGNYTITRISTTQIRYTETAADVGATANPGSVSKTSDAGVVTLSGATPAIIAGDFFRLDSTTGAPAPFSGYTLRLATITSSNLTGSAEGFPASAASTVLAWYQVIDVSGVKFFANSLNSASAIAASVNALAASPVSATATVGTGAGIIDRGSGEDAGSYPTWFNLTDGLNFVQRTIPANSPINYQLVLKGAITASLTTNSDWANETVVIAPITAKTIAAWMNTLTVSGFSTTGDAEVTSAGALNEDPMGNNLVLGGAKIQLATQTVGSGGNIQVQGGTANTASAPVVGTAANTTPSSVSVSAGGVVRTGKGLVTVTCPDIHNLQPGSFFTILNGDANFTPGVKSVLAVTSPYVFTYFEAGANASSSGTNVIQEVSYVVLSVPLASVPGFVAGAWTRIANSQQLPKPVFGAIHVLNEIRPDGSFIFTNAAATWTIRGQTAGNFLVAERVGGFMAYTFTGSTALSGLSSVVEGDWVRITSPNFPTGGAHQILKANTGIFRVVRVVPSTDGAATFTVWVVNDSGFDDEPGQCDIAFIAYASVLPGDTLQLSTSLWGSDNRGTWTIASVGSALSQAAVGGLVRTGGTTVTVTTTKAHNLSMGHFFSISPGETNFPTVFGGSGLKTVASVIDSTHFTYTEAGLNVASLIGENIIGTEYQNSFVFVVSTVDRAPVAISAPGALGSQASLVQLIEGSAYLENGQLDAYKQILSITPNQADATLVDLKYTNALNATRMGAGAGSVVEVLDKLEFPTSVFMGIDGYAHSTGLVGVSNKIVYGDPSDPATYPGVAAAGASIDISGPLVKRIQVSLQVRIRTGAVQTDVQSAIQSAVATVVNQTAVGQSIALSDIVAAASKVGGVSAVVILSPTYTSLNDLISVQPTEKPLVLNIDTDVQVSFVG